jgi:hypothetical protein
MQFVLLLVTFTVVLAVIAGLVVWPKVRRTIHQKLAMVINEVMQQREHDVTLALARHATNDSATWLGGVLMSGSAYSDKLSLLDASLKVAAQLRDGLYYSLDIDFQVPRYAICFKKRRYRYRFSLNLMIVSAGLIAGWVNGTLP